MKTDNPRCIICHKEIIRYKPTRLYRFEYGNKPYKQYKAIEHWDFCNNCFKRFQLWLYKNNQKKD